MTIVAVPTEIASGLRLLAHLMETTTIPAPYHITHCVIAANDTDGTAAIDRIGSELERAGIEHTVHDDDHSRTLTIPLGTGLSYEIFYVYRAEMAAYHASQSYANNLRLTGADR